MHLGEQLIFLEIFLRPGHLEHYYKAIQSGQNKTGQRPKVVAIRYLCDTAFLILWVLQFYLSNPPILFRNRS